MEWERALQEALGSAFESKDALAKVFEQIFSDKGLYLDGICFSGRLQDVVACDKPESEIRYELILWLKAQEQAEVFVRGLVRLGEHIALYQFVEQYADSFLTYGDDFSGNQDEILAARKKLTQIESRESFEKILRALKKVLSEVREENRVQLPPAIEQELTVVERSVVPSSVKIFLMIEILIRDYPQSAGSSESTLDRLVRYIEDFDTKQLSETKAKRAYLQILVQPAALDKTAILWAYLSFEDIGDIHCTSDLFPLHPEVNVENQRTGNLTIEFNEKKAVGAIVDLIEDGEEEIERMRDQGCDVDDSMVVEIFLPFQFLFKKVDLWQRRFGISSSETIPISQEHKIIFRSYERLQTRTFSRKLKRRWRGVTATSSLSFGCTRYVDVRNKRSLATALVNSSVFLCTLAESDEVREALVSAALESGVPMVIWLESKQETLCGVSSNMCENISLEDDRVEKELKIIESDKEKCLLFDLREAVSSRYGTWGDFGDLNGLYSLIQEALDNDDRFEGYFAILYDEPHRANRLAELFKKTKDHNLFNVS